MKGSLPAFDRPGGIHADQYVTPKQSRRQAQSEIDEQLEELTLMSESFWGKFETNCEWCGHKWQEQDKRYMISDGVPGHETIGCKSCYDSLDR